ncbi:MAG TPA: plastocyanin/azurin family copper-binding protein [Acidimicrobiales bacterium]
MGAGRAGTWLAGALLLVAPLAPLVACGDDDGGDTLSSAEPGGSDGSGGTGTTTGDAADPAAPDDAVPVDADPADVRAIDNTFDAPAIRVPAGTTVRWTNRGRQDHDVVPATGEAWGVDPEGFHPGNVYEHAFDQPGTYRYYCTIHGTADRGMVGTVVVE